MLLSRYQVTPPPPPDLDGIVVRLTANQIFMALSSVYIHIIYNVTPQLEP